MLRENAIIRNAAALIDRTFGANVSETLWKRVGEARRLRLQHFLEQTDIDACRKLFTSSVSLVEVETHSYCNRTCWFCPNAKIDRRTVKHYLPLSVYHQILEDLGSINYRGVFSLARYCEPFADEATYDRLAEARRMAPNARLVVYSNGDYLRSPELARLSEIGIHELHIGIYLPDETIWTPEAAERALARATARFGIGQDRRGEIPGERIVYLAGIGGLAVTVSCPNYAAYGIDRGNMVSGVPTAPGPRTSPCHYTVTDVYVDYTRAMVPCCQLRSDVPAHGGAILGYVDDAPGGIFRLYASAASAQWRSAMAKFSPKAGACAHCAARCWPESRLGKALYRWTAGAHPPTVRTRDFPLPVIT